MRIGIVGSGKVAKALSHRLIKNGFEIVGIFSDKMDDANSFFYEITQKKTNNNHKTNFENNTEQIKTDASVLSNAINQGRIYELYCKSELQNENVSENFSESYKDINVVSLEELVIRSEVVAIAVPDDVIFEIYSKISDIVTSLSNPNSLKSIELSLAAIFHLSGTTPLLGKITPKYDEDNENSEILSIHSFVLHPLTSVADNDPCAFDSIAFTLRSDEDSREFASSFAEVLCDKWTYLQEEDRVLYHAAAVFASNYLVAVEKVASELFKSCGIKDESYWRSLIVSTTENILSKGIDKSLTGPIARGDKGTVYSHLTELQKKHNDYVEIYKLLGVVVAKMSNQPSLIDLLNDWDDNIR